MTHTFVLTGFTLDRQPRIEQSVGFYLLSLSHNFGVVGSAPKHVTPCESSRAKL